MVIVCMYIIHLILMLIVLQLQQILQMPQMVDTLIVLLVRLEKIYVTGRTATTTGYADLYQNNSVYCQGTVLYGANFGMIMLNIENPQILLNQVEW